MRPGRGGESGPAEESGPDEASEGPWEATSMAYTVQPCSASRVDTAPPMPAARPVTAMRRGASPGRGPAAGRASGLVPGLASGLAAELAVIQASWTNDWTGRWGKIRTGPRTSPG